MSTTQEKPNGGDDNPSQPKQQPKLQPKQQQQQQNQQQPGPNSKTPSKKKMTKAERRALQEQQRAAKAARQAGGGGGGKGGPQQQQQQQKQKQQKQQQHQQQNRSSTQSPPTSDKAGEKKEISHNKYNNKTFALFSHLPQYRDPADLFMTGPALVPRTSSNDSNLHPAVIELGYLYASGRIRGGNARCRAMFQVYERMLQDFIPTSDDDNNNRNDLRQQIDHQVLKPAFTYWTTNCRPHSVSMGNAFTFLKRAVVSLDRDLSIQEMRQNLRQNIDAYVKERIVFAQRAIAQQQVSSFSKSNNTMTKTNSSSSGAAPQVILTYGHSQAIEVMLLQLKENQPMVGPIRVIVVDSRPLVEGKHLLMKLRQANIDCSYILLNAISYVMKDVHKVYLGASALMSDGSVLGRVGTACVALAAQAHHIPVLVCCESYKISNRVQLESITGNELGNPNNVASTTPITMHNTNENKSRTYTIINKKIHPKNDSGVEKKSEDDNGESLLDNWKKMDNLRMLNLLYDLTPSEFVSGIITELGIIPPTSVAVLLREMNTPQD